MIKVWLQSYTPELGRSIPLFQGSVFSGTHCIEAEWAGMTSEWKFFISILVNLRYLRFKLLKYKENNKTICSTFDHITSKIFLYNYNEKGIIRKVLFCINTMVPLLKNYQKWRLTRFAIKLFNIFLDVPTHSRANRDVLTAFERQSKDSDGIWVAFELHSSWIILISK